VVTGKPDEPLLGMAVLRLGLIISAGIAIPAIALGTALRGGPGAAGAIVGTAVVVGFFALGKLAVARVARSAPHLLLPAALGTYVVQTGLLGILLITLDGVTVIHLPTLAWTIFVGVFGWIGAELWVATHTRVPFYDPAAFAARQAALDHTAVAPEQPSAATTAHNAAAGG
jgi:ATP synthase protein I